MIDEDRIRLEKVELEQKLEQDLSGYPEDKVQYWIHRLETLNWVLENDA
jgi:hypothetical protein